jgi:protein-tyrosine-phosphatase
MAGAALEAHLPSAHVSTAGTLVVEGQPMSIRTRAALEAVGLEIPKHRSKQAGAELAHADVIVGLAPEHVAWVRRQYPAVAPRTATLRRLCRDLPNEDGTLDERLTTLALDTVVLEDWEEVVDPGGGDGPVFEACAREIVALIPQLAAALASCPQPFVG